MGCACRSLSHRTCFVRLPVRYHGHHSNAARAHASWHSHALAHAGCPQHGAHRHRRRCCSQQGPAPCGAGLGADAVGCVAVHGTGTPLGDPIEVGALGHALSREGPHKALTGSAGGPGANGAPLRLLSVKSCYGHTEGAAGLTGAMLAVQALQQQVPHLARSH